MKIQAMVTFKIQNTKAAYERRYVKHVDVPLLPFAPTHLDLMAGEYTYPYSVKGICWTEELQCWSFFCEGMNEIHMLENAQIMMAAMDADRSWSLIQ